MTGGKRSAGAALALAALLSLGCAGKSTITSKTTHPDGSVTETIQELTDEAAFVQAQQAALRPILRLTASDPDKPIELKNIREMEVYGGGGSQIQQYHHPGWDVLKTAFGVAGTVAGVYVAGESAVRLVGAVGAAGGSTITGSFNASGDQSGTIHAPGQAGAATINPSDRHDTTSTDSHDSQVVSAP